MDFIDSERENSNTEQRPLRMGQRDIKREKLSARHREKV